MRNSTCPDTESAAGFSLSFTSEVSCSIDEGGGLRNLEAKTGTRIRILNPVVMKVISALRCIFELLQLSRLISPYAKFHRKVVQSSMLSLFLSGFDPGSQNKSLNEVSGSLLGSDRVDPEA